MDEKLIRDYLEQNEQRLQKLEDKLTGKQEPKKPEENSDEIDEFIFFLKKANTTPEPEPGTDADEFINLMRNINK